MSLKVLLEYFILRFRQRHSRRISLNHPSSHSITQKQLGPIYLETFRINTSQPNHVHTSPMDLIYYKLESRKKVNCAGFIVKFHFPQGQIDFSRYTQYFFFKRTIIPNSQEFTKKKQSKRNKLKPRNKQNHIKAENHNHIH